jgi:hypothetical protein
MQRRFDGYTALCPNLDHYLASVDRILIFFTPDVSTIYKVPCWKFMGALKMSQALDHWFSFLLFSSHKMHLFREFCCLEIKDTTDTPRSASYLDLHLEIDNRGRLSTKLYDKRDDFTFPIVNFPFLCGNIPAAPTYGVYISQLLCYSRACGVYRDFLDRARLLTDKLMRQGYVAKRLKSSLLNFYGRHHDLVDGFETTV